MNDVNYSAGLIAEVAENLQLEARQRPYTYTDLCNEINELIINNFHLLVNTLYRLDVSEFKISAALAGEPHKDAAALIADLILERQLEKQKTRNLFNRKDDIPEEEKW